MRIVYVNQTHGFLEYFILIGASKKVCPLKSEPPPGDLIYEKDGYAIYQIDGEEHKVSYTLHTVTKLDCLQAKLLALRSEPLAVRQALPRDQICLLRRQHFLILYLGIARLIWESPRSSDWLFQQGENELG